MAPQTLNTTRDVSNPLTQDARGGGNIASADAHHHEGNTKLVPWLMLCAIMSGFSMAMSCAAIGAAWIMYTKFHVLTVTVDNHDALMLREGIKQPGDVAKGPNGNLEFRRKE